MNTVTYANAVSAVRDFATAKQTELDARSTEATAAARAELIALFTSAPPDDPRFAIGQLIAQTVEFPRASDGYPYPVIPPETRAVAEAAQRAGIKAGIYGAMMLHVDFSGIAHNQPAGMEVAQKAWSDARNYRDKQTHKAL